jgi:hypothetical protein
MQVALVAVSVAIFLFLIVRAIRRTGAMREGRGSRRVSERAPKRKVAVLELDGLPWERCSLDGIPFGLVGVTAKAPRGFSHVPVGRHVLTVARTAKESEKRLEVTLEPGRALVLREAGGVLVASELPFPTGPFSASYIHFPTWARGPRLMLGGGTLSPGRQDA